MKKPGTYDVADGEWIDPPTQEMCCDCGLVHSVEWRHKDGRLQVRYTRNNRATANARRRKGLAAKVTT